MRFQQWTYRHRQVRRGRSLGANYTICLRNRVKGCISNKASDRGCQLDSFEDSLSCGCWSHGKEQDSGIKGPGTKSQKVWLSFQKGRRFPKPPSHKPLYPNRLEILSMTCVTATVWLRIHSVTFIVHLLCAGLLLISQKCSPFISKRFFLHSTPSICDLRQGEGKKQWA